MKSLFTIFSVLTLLFFANFLNAQCDLEFNPSGGTYEPGDLVDVNICFTDYDPVTGKREDALADWNGADTSNDPQSADITVTGDDGNGVTITVIGTANSINSSYCINVQFITGSQGNTVTITSTATGVSSGCVKTRTQGYTLIPIKLESFDVNLNNDVVVLDWVTLSEFNNDFFTIEMSSNGVDFEEIGTVKGGGESHDRLVYQYKYKLNKELMSNPFLYFRLKQTDFDGLFTYSDVLVLPLDKNKNSFMLNNAYYSNSSLKLTVTSKDDNSIVFRMMDLNGNIISNKSIEAIRGFNEIDVPLGYISSGMYIIQLANNSGVKTRKIIINN